MPEDTHGPSLSKPGSSGSVYGKDGNRTISLLVFDALLSVLSFHFTAAVALRNRRSPCFSPRFLAIGELDAIEVQRRM
jgi:hypothetical protein